MYLCLALAEENFEWTREFRLHSRDALEIYYFVVYKNIYFCLLSIVLC